MKAKLFILLFALVGFTACHDDDPVVSPEETIEEDDTSEVFSLDEPDYGSVASNAPVFISSSIQAEVKEGLQTFLTNIASLEEAEVAVVKDEDIGSYEGKLLELYQRGGFIVVAQPEGDHFREFAGKYGLPNAIPFNASQDVLLYATSNKREHYVLYATNPFDKEDIGDPVILSMLEKNAESYYKRRIYELCRWLKEQRGAKADTRGDIQYVTQFDPNIIIKECDRISHDFSITMKHEVADRKTSKADWLDMTGSVVVNYIVYGAYVFEGTKQPGDYYIVKMDLTVRNGSSYTKFKKKHGLITHWGSGYYMKQFDLYSALIDPSKYVISPNEDREAQERKYRKLQDMAKQMLLSRKVHDDLVVAGISTYKAPSPGTTIGSTTYTSSINVSLTGSLTAGTDMLGSTAFSAGHSSSESKTVSDITIKVDTEAGSEAVKNSYITREIGSFKLPDGHDEDDVEDLIPLVARSDFNATSTWCWSITPGNMVFDGSDNGFMIATLFDYNYASYVHSSDDMFYPDGYHKNFDSVGYSYAEIPHPSREPFGLIALKNIESLPIYDISIWVQDENAGKGDPFVMLDSGYEPGEEALCALPVGTYYLEFTMKYKDPEDPTHMVESRWKIENLEVKSNPEQSKATTSTSTGKADLVEVKG